METRSWLVRTMLVAGFLIIGARLIDLTIVRGAYFRELAEGNRVRRVPIVAARGNILARGGEILVGNIEIKKRLVFSPTEGFEKLDDVSGADPSEIITEIRRDYKLGPAFAHVSGYLGEVNPEEVGKIDPKCQNKGPMSPGGLVGRSGLEEEYNCILSGIDGEELVEVDTLGRKIRILGRKSPIAGKDLQTNIDFRLQKKTAEVISGQGLPGAAVISDAKGQILAFYSNPSFDPNLFNSNTKPKEIENLLNNKALPLFDRVIGGAFHPGSVFKPLVAIAALEENKITENYTFDDPGVISIDDKFFYSNWYFSQYGKKEGQIGLARAIARSTDTFFYKIGELTGPVAIAEWAYKMGYGAKSGIDLPGEIAGLIPTPEWKLRVKNEAWFLGNTYHMAIGQGDVAVTPIQMNLATGVIANGKYCRPKVVGESKCSQIPITKSHLALVKEGMVEACSPGGTGFTFFDFAFPDPSSDSKVACKTGTAETSLEGETHAWFTVFGPADFPEIVATIIIENGGEGSKMAGPLARKIFDFYFAEP